MTINIGGVQKFSLLDFPDKIAAIVFTRSCNFKCGYCHNPELFIKNNKTNIWDEKTFFKFLNTRKGRLDGVVVTGGEPTLYKDLPDFIKEIKYLGFDVKLDTNGTNPDMVDYLINNQLLDYVAMDIKAPLDKYSKITNTKVNTDLIQKSIELLQSSNISYEFRTTVLKCQLSYEDFDKIGKLINGAPLYYLQKFIPSKILDKSLENEKTYTEEEFKPIVDNLKKYIKNVLIR